MLLDSFFVLTQPFEILINKNCKDNPVRVFVKFIQNNQEPMLGLKRKFFSRPLLRV